MTTFLTVVYVFVCLFLITVVLLQAGRGGGMGAAFGGSSQTVFGGAGAGNFLTRLTVVMAAAFMLLSATLAYLSSSSDKALEEATEKVRMREEARDVDATGAGAAEPGAEGAEGLESAPASSQPEAAGEPDPGAAMGAPTTEGSEGEAEGESAAP